MNKFYDTRTPYGSVFSTVLCKFLSGHDTNEAELHGIVFTDAGNDDG